MVVSYYQRFFRIVVFRNSERISIPQHALARTQIAKRLAVGILREKEECREARGPDWSLGRQ